MKQKEYWKETPKVRFEAWNKYKALVDREVKRLETAYKKETNAKLKEDCRNVLNEMYLTQSHLEHDSI
jgi:hypothetical protein